MIKSRSFYIFVMRNHQNKGRDKQHDNNNMYNVDTNSIRVINIKI